MDYLFYVDWEGLLRPKFSVLEMIIRGGVVYICLVLLLRSVLKRHAGKIALTDLLVITLVTGVCRNPLIADSYSIVDGIGIVIVVLGFSYLVHLASFYSPWFHALVHPAPVQLIQDGKLIHEHLKQELMTEYQMYCKLRSKGVKEIMDVAEAWIEGDGQVSVVKNKR